MTRLQVPLLLIAALLVALAPAGPATANHCPPGIDHGEPGCTSEDSTPPPEDTPPPSTPNPTPAPTQEPEPEPQPEPDPTPEPQPQPQPEPDPTAAPTRDTSPSRTTTSRSTPRPTASPDGTPEPTPLETPDPDATPEILVQGPVLDDSSDDEERLDVAQGAAENEGSGGWAFFLVGFLLGGGIGWVGRGIRSMRRRRKQQLFG